MSEFQRWMECQEASEYLSNRLDGIPSWAIVTGTGLSGVQKHFEIVETIPYSDIPNMPTPSVSSHMPELCVIRHQDRTALLFCGRFHHYEGRDMHEITFPIRICQGLKIVNLILTNAAGGLRPDFSVPQIVVIRDHIYLLPDHPLRGLTMEEWGNRFPDPKSIYDGQLRSRVKSALTEQGFNHHEGIYACLSGPSLETHAELRYLKAIGADLVGMSTVPEVLVAAQCDMRVLALSVVTNDVNPDAPLKEVSLQDVIDASRKAIQPLAEVIQSVIAS